MTTITRSTNPSFLSWRPTISSSRHSSTSSINSFSTTTDSEHNHNNNNNENTNEISSQRRVVPKLKIRMGPNPVLLNELEKPDSGKSSLPTIKLSNGKRSSIRETSSLRSNKRRKT